MNEGTKKPGELGALWVKTGTRGEYMTGMIDGKPVVCFRNEHKMGKQPDWRVLRAQPRDSRPEPDPEVEF